MPVIQAYQRRQSIPGVSVGVVSNPGAAGAVGDAISNFGKTGMAVANNAEDLILRRDLELKKQKENNFLIEQGALINNDVSDFEQQYKTDNKGVNATGSQERVGYFTQSLLEKYASGDADPNTKLKIKQNILAHDYRLKSSLAGYEAEQLKNYATGVRALDYESSKKMAQNGDIEAAVTNYKKTLQTQLADNSMSQEQYDIERKKGASGLYEQYIEGLLANDPVSAREVFKVAKKDLLADTQDRLEKVIKPAVTMRQGMDAATQIFKADTTGNLETMIDKVKGKKLDPEAEKIAISSVKDQWSVRKADEAKETKAVSDNYLGILNDAAMGNDGLNTESDLTPAQWAKFNETNPALVKTLLDSMRREKDYVINQQKAEDRAVELEAKADKRVAEAAARADRQAAEAAARADRQEARENRWDAAEARRQKLYDQGENESAILLDPDFRTRDLAADYAGKLIDTTMYRKLLAEQKKLDPMNSETTKRGLRAVYSGTALADSMGLKRVDTAEVAVWKQKYGDLVKAFAYNNSDKPDYDAKMTDFLEKQVFTPMAQSWFSLDSTDRMEKFQADKAVAGPLPVKKERRSAITKTINGITYTKENGKWMAP